MKKYIEQKELDFRISLNRDRLMEDYYSIENVFDIGSDWPGDKAGRALLAFVSHYKINKSENPCMHLMMDKIPEVTNGKCYFDKETKEVIFEQQLSGHSWYLRGLCEYYEQFGDERALDYMQKTIDDIYMPTKGRFSTYPIEREYDDGGVSGHSYDVHEGWKLSTDVGCAFMSIDGLSHYYKLTKDHAVKELLDEMIGKFMEIDKYRLKAQTHCTLTAGRGMIRMYEVTNEQEYLESAKEIFQLYITKGMTYTYQNFNWFGRGDTWTEPCAIVDSLMLAGMLYNITRCEDYRTYAARIYWNGLSTVERPNGGAGTDHTVSDKTHSLKMHGYEAMFCCTMRLAEGLWYINENKDDLYANTSEKLEKDSVGRYFSGDILYGKVLGNESNNESIDVDERELEPIIKFYTLKDEEECRNVKQQMVFC